MRASLSGFKELVETPALAAEVTIQPVDILGVDAAIIFSDILVIPEAMGLKYEMIEKKGPSFPETIQTMADVDRMITGEDAAGELKYVYDALALTNQGESCLAWDAETREALRVAASVDGLQAKVGGVRMHDIAREAVALSEQGLKARARSGAGGMVPDETHFLNALKESIETGKVPADELLEDYDGKWKGDLSRIYADYSY